MSKQIYFSSIALAVLFAMGAPVAAQTISLPPQLDPGAAQRRSMEQQREIEQQRDTREIITSPLQVEELPERQEPQAPQLSFVLKGVQINDSVFLQREELIELVRPHIGKTVTFADLEELVAQINVLYRSRDIATAQAVLPPQKIDDGIVRIELVEGRVGKVDIQGSRYTKEGFFHDRLPLEAGTVVDTRELQQSLIRFNRTGDIQLQAALQPGQDFGTTDVLIAVNEPERNIVQLFADNQGVESTGLMQYGVIARHNGLFGWGDQASLYLVNASGTKTGSASFSVPVNRSNGRVSVSYARNTLEIIKGPFTALNITGESSTVMLGYRQPFRVQAHSQWDMSLSLSRSDSETQISGIPFSESTVNKYGVGISYDRTTNWGRWLTSHTLSMASVDAATEDWPSFTAYSGSVNVLYPWRPGWTVVANFGWQWLNEEQAPASELYQIGGLGSVRGYEQGVLSAARGYQMQLELHKPLRDGLSAFAFFDMGSVFPEPKEQISSVGVGVNYRYNKRWSVDASYGHTMKKVVPDQSSGRLDARIVLSF